MTTDYTNCEPESCVIFNDESTAPLINVTKTCVCASVESIAKSKGITVRVAGFRPIFETPEMAAAFDEAVRKT